MNETPKEVNERLLYELRDQYAAAETWARRLSLGQQIVTHGRVCAQYLEGHDLLAMAQSVASMRESTEKLKRRMGKR